MYKHAHTDARKSFRTYPLQNIPIKVRSLLSRGLTRGVKKVINLQYLPKSDRLCYDTDNLQLQVGRGVTRKNPYQVLRINKGGQESLKTSIFTEVRSLML